MFTFLYKSFSGLLKSKNLHLIRSLMYYSGDRTVSEARLDYIRLSTLELKAGEINQAKLAGSVAELGVYKGDFARHINRLFPDRKLYLYDTFKGFDESDVKAEKARSFSTGEQDFSDTSVKLVLDKVPFPKQCVVRQGFFPQTFTEQDEKFVFVSLDADLYEPILAGLNEFYPRLVQGGAIFVHDYNNEEYKGAKQAVQEFCSKNNVPFIPIADICGSAIILK